MGKVARRESGWRPRMKLTAKAVQDVLRSLLYTSEELGPAVPEAPPQGSVLAKAVVSAFAFHPKRLEAAKPEIAALLRELPAAFHELGSDMVRLHAGPVDAPSGGWSFLNACMTKDDEQWGEHRNIDELLALGLAAGYVSWCMPRDMWDALPGGMPYFVISKEVWDGV